MATENNKNEPGLNVNIKEYVDMRMKDLEGKCDQRSDHLESKCDQRSDHLNQLLDNSSTAISLALSSVDERFKAVNEFRDLLSDQQRTFARQTDVDLVMTAVEKATQKSETATERRFEAVNEFRSQLADQQATFIRKTEVDIRFEALEKKLDLAVSQLQLSKGRESGFSSAGGILTIVLTLVLCAIGIVVAFSKH